MPELVPIKKRIATVRDLLARMGPELAKALPKTLTADRLARVVVTDGMAQMQRNKPGAPTLFDCTEQSLASAVLQCAQCGLEPGGVLGLAHIIPYRNTRAGTVEAQFQPGYRGLITLAVRSGVVTSIMPIVVHERDRYTIHLGSTPSIRHEPFRPTAESGDAGPAMAFYAVAFLRHGGIPPFHAMWRHEVERHRDRFARNVGEGTPWADYFDQMAMKTCIKLLCKTLPASSETLAAVIARDDKVEAELPVDGPTWVPTLNKFIETDPGDADALAPGDGASKLDEAVANRRRSSDPGTAK